jgi:hemolysin activation/secretion protein
VIRPLILLVALIAGPASAQEDAAPPVPAAEDPAFDVLEYRIEGNTVLSRLAVETAVYPHLGPERRFADVEAARASLEKTYQSAGYLTVLVEIPEQQVQQGIVRLRVTEGRVGKLRIQGARYFDNGYLRAQVPSLAEGIVPQFQEVQRELAAVGRNPDRKVTPVLRPGKAPGEVEVDLKVEDQLPLHGDVELNNRQTPDTEPLRFQASLRYDNLWQRGHSVSALFQTAPEDTEDVRVFSGTYVMPVDDDGSVLAFYGVRSDSDVASIGGTNVIGKGNILGGRWIKPLRGREDYFHSLAVGIDYKDFDETVRQGSDDFQTPVTYVPITAQYRFTASGRRTHSGSIGLNAAPRLLPENDDDEFEEKRFAASGAYVYLRGDWTTEQPLPRSLRLRARAEGQLSSGPLISNEQYSAGGAENVRGYLEAERFGDDAIVGSLELQWRVPRLGSAEAVQELLAIAFVDAGILWVREALPDQQEQFGLSSAGLGLRLKAYSHLVASLDVAVPFAAGQETDLHDPRAHFRVAYQF